MVNLHDPAKVALDLLTVVKLWHTVDGLYIWEFVTTLDYEWSVFRGDRKYLWTIWIYSLTRVATLAAVITNMIGFDATRPINCQAWVTLELVFSYTALASASLLIVLRMIAIWDRNKIIFVIATGAWLANLSFLIHSIVELRSSRAPAQVACVVLNTDSSKYNILSNLVTDIILLLIMLIGLFRLHFNGTMFGLGRLLLTQGIAWLLLATVAEVPPAVLIILNLNDPFNLMFQMPALIAMTIAATRMYRSLANFDSDNSRDRPQIHTHAVTNRTAGPIPLNRMEVAVYTNSKHCPESRPQESQSDLYTTDGQMYDKTNGLVN